MSELKSFIVLYDGKFIRAYEESEADKVIAELKQQIEILQKEKKIIQDLYIGESDDCRIWASRAIHNKYKRCLAIAQEWRSYATFCGMQSHCHNHRGFGKTAENYTRKEIHAWKCVKSWLAIAEKFKGGV